MSEEVDKTYSKMLLGVMEDLAQHLVKCADGCFATEEAKSLALTKAYWQGRRSGITHAFEELRRRIAKALIQMEKEGQQRISTADNSEKGGEEGYRDLLCPRCDRIIAREDRSTIIRGYCKCCGKVSQHYPCD